MNVLLVEDSDVLRHLFARVLRRHGATVREAEHGLAALAALADFRPDVVLTDLMMPVMDGFELIERLKAHPATAAVPVVVVTAAASPEAVAEAVAAVERLVAETA